ncbi:LOW QUALITY PROTEIN: inosine-uridine preferring nucleoside hydrolase-like [Pangshura tecta]
MTKLLLIDVDCGVDDAQAIMMGLASPSVEILGITCCYGNTVLENICKNVLRVLQVCNRLEIQVYQDASAPLLGGPVKGAMYHGRDGLGDVPVVNDPGLDHLQKEHAVIAMLRIVNEKPGQISLVATGPLTYTHLALAVKLDPTFPQKLKNLFIMGGNVESRGNVTVCEEFNFATGPEAAYVLNEFTCPTYIATWEFTCRNSLSWEFYHEWVNQNTKKAKFMEKISEHSIKFTDPKHENTSNIWISGFVSCDSYAMAAAIDESFVTGAIETAVSVELNGSLTRGMMVMDMDGRLKKKNKAFDINKCDLEKF